MINPLLILTILSAALLMSHFSGYSDTNKILIGKKKRIRHEYPYNNQ